MKIDIVTVGKVKEDFVLRGIKHYQKPLSKFATLHFNAIKPESISDQASSKDKDKAKEKEGKALLNRAKPSYKIALSYEGQTLSSEKFAKLLQEIQTYHGSKVTFFIGGSHGLSPEVKTKSDKIISLSKLTFPHQLTVLLLSEQIFRAFKIINNEPYHK